MLPGKQGGRPVDWAHVVVEIPDTPGSLARLFGDIEAAGVNVEDITIEHDAERRAGWLGVDVSEEAADLLADAMIAAGWNVRPGPR